MIGNREKSDMNREDVKIIEADLNISLPESYKEVILNYPFDDSFDGIKDYLWNDFIKIVKGNLYYRENGFHGKTWPDCFYIIGKMIGDNIFYINLNDVNSETIYFLCDEDKYNPENIKKDRYSDSFQEFIHQCKFLQKIHDNP